MSFSEVECPACKEKKDKIVWGKYDYIEAANHFCSESRNTDRNNRLKQVIRDLWKQDFSYVLRCTSCGFGFGYPYLGGNESFYNILHEQFGYPVNRWEYDITINLFFTQDAVRKILDIGAGNGYFLNKVDCKKKYALEGSDTTRSILKSKGIIVYKEQSALVRENRGEFNYVTMYQVLEHISDFENLFITINRLLVPGGNLVISVPDCEAMINQEKLTGCLDMIPNHINKWSPESLSIVLNRFGFETDQLIYEPASFKKFMHAVYLKILGLAALKGSFASKIYTVKNKKIRIAAMSLYSLILIPGLLIHYEKLNGKSSFLIRAVKRNELP